MSPAAPPPPSPAASAATRRRPRVLVVQRRMTHYRVPFFEALRRALDGAGCELVLAYGAPTAAEGTKRDEGQVAWAHRLPTRYLLGGRLCWQPFAPLMRDADVAVLTPENKLVNNLPAQLLQQRCRIMLWGHGANLQGDPHSLRERVKRWVGRHADWWLAYTAMSLPLIRRTGFPAERVTVLNNAVDTVELSALHAAVTEADVRAVRERYRLAGGHVGVYVGSLYADKRIDVLLDAAHRIRARVPDFELLVFGSGPQKPEVEAFCAAHPWAHYGGVATGRDKVAALAASRVMLNPGLVGLGILDSFVCGVPMLTTDCGLHSPEIAYLDNGVNGVMTPDDTGAFVDAAVKLLQDPAALERLRSGCRESAKEYTVENMAARFAGGVRQCLEAPRWR